MFEQGRVIGVRVTAGSFEKIAHGIVQIAQEGFGGYVCVANVHMVTTARRDATLRSVMESAVLVVSDGMPLVWGLRRQGFTNAERVAGPDLMIRLCDIAAAKRLPVFFLGGSSKTIGALRKIVATRFPALQISGYESPPVLPQRPEMDPDVVDRIKTSGARIVFVGLGCPKQEIWMAAYAPYLSAILVGVGAAFDFLAKTKPRAPLWMQRSGLEWLFRLINEPRRLWKRYLITNSLFIWYLIKDRVARN